MLGKLNQAILRKIAIFKRAQKISESIQPFASKDVFSAEISSTLFFSFQQYKISKREYSRDNHVREFDSSIPTSEGPISIKKAAYKFDPELEYLKSDPNAYFEAFMKKTFGNPLPANTMFVFLKPTYYPNIIERDGYKEVGWPFEIGHISSITTNDNGSINRDTNIDFSRSHIPVGKKYDAEAKVWIKDKVETVYFRNQTLYKGKFHTFSQTVSIVIDTISRLTQEGNKNDITIIALPGFQHDTRNRIINGIKFVKGEYFIDRKSIITKTPYIISTSFINDAHGYPILKNGHRVFLSSGRNCDVILFFLAKYGKNINEGFLKDYEKELSSAYPESALLMLIYDIYGFDVAKKVAIKLSQNEKFKANLITSRYRNIIEETCNAGATNEPKLL